MTPRSLLLSILVLMFFSSPAWSSPTCNNYCCRFVEDFPPQLKKLRLDYLQIRDFYVSTSMTFTSAGTLCSITWTDPQHAAHGATSAPSALQVLFCLPTSASADTASQHAEHDLFLSSLQEANDDLDTSLLDQSVEDSFNSPFACHTMNSILDFYLSTVLPTAMAGVTEETRNLKPHMESIQQIFDRLKSDVTRCKRYFLCKKQFDIRNLNSTYTQMESKGLYKAM
ncbi:hypothetical protein L3Q82_025024, partial [Scortum barcoo]